MNCYRPTTLKLASAHCPRAVDHYERNRPAFREHFWAGIAAHEVLAAIGVTCHQRMRQPELGEMLEVSQQIVRSMVTTGRNFEGVAEPPMPMEDARAGEKLALEYAADENTTWRPSAKYEAGYAFDSQWRSVAYGDPARRFRLILDYLDIVEDEGEEYSGRMVLVRDYKTAWSTSASELETFQMKAQAVAGWMVAGDVDGVRREVVNLRSREVFRDDLWLESGGREQLEEWRRDITTYMQALDDMIGPDGQRPARPGAGCLSCPWSLCCDDSAVKGTSAEQMGQRLALIEGQRMQLIKALKLAAKGEPMAFGADRVGWRQTSEQTPADAAARAMYEAWTAKGGDVAGFLAALKPGMGALRAIAKKLHPDDKAEQATAVAAWSRAEPGREFTIWRATDVG